MAEVAVTMENDKAVAVTIGENTHRVLWEHDGRYIIAEKPDSMHAGDSHLTIVLAVYGTQYVTWMANHSDGGTHYGHYYGGNFEEAMKDFLGRGTYPWNVYFKGRDE